MLLANDDTIVEEDDEGEDLEFFEDENALPSFEQ